MNYILLFSVLALIAGVIIFNAVRNSKIRKNGIEADAVVSRIDEDDMLDSDGGVTVTYTHYVTYRTQDGRTVEAKLNHAPGRTHIGDRVRIKYMPEKPGFAILLKE